MAAAATTAPATGGIINSAMNPSATDPNAPTNTTASNTNPPTATTAPTSTTQSGSNISQAPDTSSSVSSSPTDYYNQLNSAASSSSSPTPSNKSSSPSGSSGSSSPATAADIQSDFASDFGRPAASQGLSFYENTLAQNPNMTQAQLNAAIEGGAQTQDKAAEASLNGSGSVAQNWTSPNLNPAGVVSNQDIWNAATNSWQTAPTTANTNSQGANASTYQANLLGTPTQLNVAPNQTVQGQIANITDPNNPLMMQARTQALQQANASGLLNSSMAITAGQNAVYNAAIPIAEQDAGIYNNDAVTNAAAANNFAIQNQAAQNTALANNANSQNTLAGQNISSNTSIQNALTAANASIATNAASNASSQAIAQLNNANQLAIQNSSTVATAGTTYQQALSAISALNTDSQGKYNLEVQAYNAYVQQVRTLDESAGVPDVSGLLNFNQVDPATGVVDPLNADGTVGQLAARNSINSIASGTPATSRTPTQGLINAAMNGGDGGGG